MNAPYQVKLEIFEGPLDLLLYLIKKQDMDIRDISISAITQEYLAYIELMKDLNLEMAGEFLVMASTLLQIKARNLLPQDPSEQQAEEGPDPRAELVAKLLEYQKYKEAAKFLSEREQAWKDVYYRNVTPAFAEDDMVLDATIFDLLDAFKDVLKTATDDVKEFLFEEIPIEQKIREVLDMLEEKEFIHFSDLFTPQRSRRELIMIFLAVLELIRLKQIAARQTDAFDEIRVYRVTQQEAPAGASAADETAPEAEAALDLEDEDAAKVLADVEEGSDEVEAPVVPVMMLEDDPIIEPGSPELN